MPLRDSPEPVAVLVGPTAVGKTGISLSLAEAFHGEIISADSRLFYRGMDIGTAKPSEEDRARIPHHLIDVAAPDDIWSMARFKREALQAIRAIQERGRLPLLVGGTGQYVWALVEGWSIPEVRPNPRLRAVLEAWGSEIGPDALHRRLALIDPEAAGHIDARNMRRTIRAIEVIFSTGRRASLREKQGDPGFDYLVIGLTRPREELYARIDQRIEEMMAAGFVAEVERLLAQGYSPELPSFSAIGYREISSFLRGYRTYEETVREIKRGSRRYVRRQANWFKLEDPRIKWFMLNEYGEEDILHWLAAALENGSE